MDDLTVVLMTNSPDEKKKKKRQGPCPFFGTLLLPVVKNVGHMVPRPGPGRVATLRPLES